jgi:hypothetical protein
LAGLGFFSAIFYKMLLNWSLLAELDIYNGFLQLTKISLAQLYSTWPSEGSGFNLQHEKKRKKEKKTHLFLPFFSFLISLNLFFSFAHFYFFVIFLLGYMHHLP